jgi:cell fate (sporulation/competence/biofilm development) regulator YmcA (YheA/YmcA/DUF963 family)
MDDINQTTELQRRKKVVNFASRIQQNLPNISHFNKTAVFLDKIEGLIKIKKYLHKACNIEIIVYLTYTINASMC